MKSLDIFVASISKFNSNYLGDAGIREELLIFFFGEVGFENYSWRSGTLVSVVVQDEK